jgi:hypothetical protein
MEMKRKLALVGGFSSFWGCLNSSRFNWFQAVAKLKHT